MFSLSQKYFGTTLESWLIAAGLALAVTFGLVVARRFAVGQARRWAARTDSRFDDVVVGLLASLRFLFFLALGLWVASEYVRLSKEAQHTLRTAVILLTLVQVGLSVQAAARALSSSWAAKASDGETKTVASAAAFLASLAVWAVLVITGLSTLGVEISALVAGLGVGGVAAALAVQNILGDLFASLSIYFDKPFHIGDFIVVGNDMGEVERIGLRSTRIRATGGEEIVFGNADLTKSRIRNFKRMRERRVQFTLAVEYTTPVELLQEIPGLIEGIIKPRAEIRFDRAHLKEFAESSLKFEVAYVVLSADHNLHVQHQHAINLEILREFAAREIQFAFPTNKTLLVPQGSFSLRHPSEPDSESASEPPSKS